MRYKLFLIIFIISGNILFPESIFAKRLSLKKGALSGKVTDLVTGQPIFGATIYISDLKTGSSSGPDGTYSINNLPQTKLIIHVNSIGYKMIIKQVDLSVTTTMDFTMEVAISELSEIVVTGLSGASEKHRTPTPVTTIPYLQLQQINATNIIGAMATQPGISQITTGAAISKPVIRGLGFNRVVVVYDGIRQEGQQWGDEHGIEIDEFSVDRVEILKGPASLMYGSDAMAGVINFLTAPTLPSGTISGKFLANYQTNNGQVGYSLNVAGNKNDFLWDLRWSQKLAHAYKNKYDGYVLNSGFKEEAFGGIVGIKRAWGYSHLHFSIYNMQPGIVEGERDSLSGKFIQPVALNDSVDFFQTASADELQSYSIKVPFQNINHYKLVLNNNFITGNGSFKAILGWQQNQRKEYGSILNPDKYGLYFLLNTVNYDLRYVFPEQQKLNYSIGVNGMFQQSQNKGTEFLVPEYNLFDAGVYGIAKLSFNKLDISGGIRYDMREEAGKDLFLNENGVKVNSHDINATRKFIKFNTTFNGVSGSLGAAYQLSEIFYTKLNLSRGFRAPNIAELGSNGEHEGSGRYEIGNAGLKAENSLQLDYTFGINSGHVTGELSLFTNTISNFIFISRLSGMQGTDSIIDEAPVYVFTSGDANLKGGEISIDIHPHPLDWLHIENTFSYVEGMQLHQSDSVKYLPFIPAPKFTSELKAASKKLNRNFINAYLKAGFEYYFKQDKFYTVNNTETQTLSYALFNVTMGSDLLFRKKTALTISFSINNVFDKAYQSHLSRLKYAPENYAAGRRGVFEMGRNFSFKVIVPFQITSAAK